MFSTEKARSRGQKPGIQTPAEVLYYHAFQHKQIGQRAVTWQIRDTQWHESEHSGLHAVGKVDIRPVVKTAQEKNESSLMVKM